MKPLICLVVAALLYGPAAHAEREWHESTTGGIRIVSSVSAARTKKIAQDVELYFEAVRRIIEHPHVRPLMPVNMLVLDGTLWRKAVDGAGRYGGRFGLRPSSSEVIINADAWDSASLIVFHELTHLVLRQNEPLRGLPAWYNEGHAELLSTIEIKNGYLSFGVFNGLRWQSLQWLPRMPLDKVLTVGLTAAEIHRRDDLAAFYAQALLIAHHAVFQSPARGEQLRRYRQLLVADVDPRAALDSAFGSQLETYERELSQYAKRSRMAYVKLPIDSLNTATVEVRPLPKADGLNVLGRWLIDMNHIEEPQLKFLGELAKGAPPESIAALQFANALIQHGQLPKAKPLVAAGCVAPTSMRNAQLCGDAYWREFSASPDPSLARNARKYYEIALQLEPDNLDALLSAAATFEAAPADSTAVRAGLEAALQRNPKSSWISARLGQLYRPLDLRKARDYMERAVLAAQDREQERSYALELNRIGSELAAQ
jgi:hypothetical protein